MDIDAKKWLSGMSPAELGTVAADAGLRPFAARQIADWLYKNGRPTSRR